MRVIDIPNGGLSAARNVGLAEATGEIVAYTDADTRVDRDWLTFLVQPFLTSDVVGSGGPNVVPADDPPMAQCIARAPGGPTHVLLDDRIAEHVPGCNMAFRRDALLAIGGFNPIYLRAGDDVDVCWRLQARGWKIGFASAALVWHHHRASVKAYWRQQVGYGEGETLADGAPSGEVPRRPHAVARTHLQSAAVRALALGHAHQRRRLGHGGVPVGLPHRRPSVRVPAALDQVAGHLVRADARRAWRSPATGQHRWAAALLLGSGVVGIAVTIAKNIAYALRSDVDSLPGSRLWYRAIGRLSAFHPAARARARAHPRRAVAAGSGAAAGAAADQPRAAAVARARRGARCC